MRWFTRKPQCQHRWAMAGIGQLSALHGGYCIAFICTRCFDTKKVGSYTWANQAEDAREELRRAIAERRKHQEEDDWHILEELM